MSKKAINVAIKNVRMHGYLKGLASFECNLLAMSERDDELYTVVRALEMLEILSWDEALEMLYPVFDEATKRGYTEKQLLAEIKAHSQV